MGETMEYARADKVIDYHETPSVSHNDKTTQPNVMESMDSKTLDCKGIDNEKTSQNIQGKTLHTRGIDCASKHYCGTASSSNDLSASKAVESPVCNIIDCYDSANAECPKDNCTTYNKNQTQYSKDDANSLAWHNLTPSQKAQAKQREKILLDYESAKSAGIKVAHFIELKNKEDSTLKLTQGKLFDWQRKYKTQGLSALSDKRGVAKTGTNFTSTMGTRGSHKNVAHNGQWIFESYAVMERATYDCPDVS